MSLVEPTRYSTLFNSPSSCIGPWPHIEKIQRRPLLFSVCGGSKEHLIMYEFLILFLNLIVYKIVKNPIPCMHISLKHNLIRCKNKNTLSRSLHIYYFIIFCLQVHKIKTKLWVWKVLNDLNLVEVKQTRNRGYDWAINIYVL